MNMNQNQPETAEKRMPIILNEVAQISTPTTAKDNFLYVLMNEAFEKNPMFDRNIDKYFSVWIDWTDIDGIKYEIIANIIYEYQKGAFKAGFQTATELLK